jgi:hypothetical protein
VYVGTIIKIIATKKYDDFDIREHIIKMTNFANKLKPFDIKLKNDFVIHLILVSLPKAFESFVVNYNFGPKKWTIKKLIAMCV